MKKTAIFLLLLIHLILLTSCPTEEDVKRYKKILGNDLLEKYSTIEYYDSGKEKKISIPMEFEYAAGIDSPGTYQVIKLSSQEYDNPNKMFTVTVKAELTEGLDGFLIYPYLTEFSKLEFTIVGDEEKVNGDVCYWSKDVEGFAVIQFKIKPEWSNWFNLYWETNENHYLYNGGTRWQCYVESE